MYYTLYSSASVHTHRFKTGREVIVVFIYREHHIVVHTLSPRVTTHCGLDKRSIQPCV